jgi:DNA-binding NarL/FixJ family response regulator
MARTQYRPDIIRLVVATASELVFNEINLAVLDEADIEIVGIVTQADELLSTVKATSPHVVCVDTQLDNKWDDFVKQVADYGLQLMGEPIPLPNFRDAVAYKNWQVAYAQRYVKGISVVVLSSDDSDSMMQRGMLSGASFLLPVPINRELVHAIRIVTTYVEPTIHIRSDYKYTEPDESD